MSSSDNALHQLSQLTVQIQSASQDLVGYEIFFGEDNVDYVQSGAESMMAAIQGLLADDNGVNLLADREIRHDLRNKVAVVKGFSDLMKMDLPESHSANGMLERLTSRCSEFIVILDRVKSEEGPGEFRLAG